MRKIRIDKPLAIVLAALIVGGSAVFVSAAFGVLAKGSTHIYSVVFNHMVLGIGLGLFFLFVTSRIEYRVWRIAAPYAYCAALLLTVLVFVPHIGLEHGGGRRWIALSGFSFQPSELLKIATVLMCASYFSRIKEKSSSSYGLAGFAAILILPAALLIAQPDIGTLGVLCIAALAMF